MNQFKINDMIGILSSRFQFALAVGILTLLSNHSALAASRIAEISTIGGLYPGFERRITLFDDGKIIFFNGESESEIGCLANEKTQAFLNIIEKIQGGPLWIENPYQTPCNDAPTVTYSIVHQTGKVIPIAMNSSCRMYYIEGHSHTPVRTAVSVLKGLEKITELQ